MMIEINVCEFQHDHRKRATEVAASIAQGGHVNFTKFSVHLHFSMSEGDL